VRVDVDDLDYRLIDSAFSKLEEYRADWIELENIYRNVKDKELCTKSKKLNRSYESTPIARDSVLIKRSIFSTSFLIDQFALSINKLGIEDDERARQLRVACRHYWEKSNAFVEINKTMLRMIIFPVGISMQFWCEKKKKIVIEECNPMDVAFDNEAKHHEDVQYLCYRYRKSGKDIAKIIKDDKKKDKKERFYNHLKDHKEFFLVDYDRKYFEPFKRYELKEIYIKEDGFWLCKTYYKDILMRVAKFNDCPFQWGFTREQLSSVDEARREKQQLVYGESEIDFIKEHVRAINKRRNQHSDIVEEQINRSVYVGKTAKVNPADLKRGPGSKIPCGNVNDIQERTAPVTMGIHDDLSMLQSDIETTTSVSGNQKGVTSTSDRRPTGAIAILNSQSSTRTEEQIITANNTLFSPLAESFVKKVWRYTDDETLLALGIEEPLIGRDQIGDDEKFEFIVKVNFGSDAKRNERYASLMEMISVVGQHPNTNPVIVEEMIKEGVSIKEGDESNLYKRLFVNQEAVNNVQPPTLGGAI
jgi:hypothetical protein